MAVRNEYVVGTTYRNADGSLKKLAPSELGLGSKVLMGFATFEVAAADDDGSIFRLATLPATAKLIDIKVATDGLTGSTDWDMGFYDPLGQRGGLEVDKDILMDGQTLASAADFGNPTALDGMDNVAIEYAGTRTIWEHLTKSISAVPRTAQNEYDLALTANTIGSGTGTVSVQYTYTCE